MDNETLAARLLDHTDAVTCVISLLDRNDELVEALQHASKREAALWDRFLNFRKQVRLARSLEEAQAAWMASTS